MYLSFENFEITIMPVFFSTHFFFKKNLNWVNVDQIGTGWVLDFHYVSLRQILQIP